MKARAKGPLATEEALHETASMSIEALTPANELADLVSASDALFSMVLDRTSDGVLLSNRHGVIVYANQPLLELFGYQPAELIGKRIDVLIPEDFRRTHRHHVDNFGKSPQQRPMGRPDLDIEGRHADGTLIPVDVQLVPLADTGFVVATVRDMTEQRQEAAERALSTLDLARSRADNDRLGAALDHVVQRLFALGMSISATAAQQNQLADRLHGAVDLIDEVIETVQGVRKQSGARPSAAPPPSAHHD